MPARSETRRLTAVVGAAFLLILLAGCTAAPGPGASATPSPEETAPPATTAPPSVTPTPTPVAPTLRPGGSAEDNLAFFEQTIAAYVGAYGRGERALLVGHLRGAGFDPAMIESGWATTPNGLQEVSIEVSVRFGDDCLIATVRDDRSTTAVMPALSTGHCLIGDGFGDSG